MSTYKVNNGAPYYVYKNNEFSPRDKISGEQICNIEWIVDGHGRMIGGNYDGFWVDMSQASEYTAPTPPPTEPPAGVIYPFQVSTGKPGYTAIIESNIDGVVTGRFEPNA